eukprot:GAHX01002576.1.p1 GENE.GAHX01002576.1~~GAHX01002576.1.p1  ORF type:complete len:113 (+),score=20.66 GAHX01002576.1:81-419(+)
MPINCAPLPNTISKTYACINCRLLKTKDQFVDSGCENCKLLNIHSDSVNYEPTNITKNFKGMVFHCNLTPSNYVAKFTKTTPKIAGFYALTMLDEEIEDDYEDDVNSDDEFY